MSAAAVIGVFSWPSAEKSFWLAKMFWHWSLIASFFSLISSAQQRLLRELPQQAPGAVVDDDRMQNLVQASLQLVLSSDPTHKKDAQPPSLQMIWVWQSPTMLMSYAWMLFFLGYALHILTPVFEELQGDWSRMTIPVSQSQPWPSSLLDADTDIEKMASVTTAFCVLMFANFHFCASVTRRRLDKVAKEKERCLARQAVNTGEPKQLDREVV